MKENKDFSSQEKIEITIFALRLFDDWLKDSIDCDNCRQKMDSPEKIMQAIEFIRFALNDLSYDEQQKIFKKENGAKEMLQSFAVFDSLIKEEAH